MADLRLSDLLVLARRRTGRGLRETARIAGVAASFIARLESGEQAPRLAPETLARVAVAYGVEADLLWLACGRAPPDIVEGLRRRPESLVDVRKTLAKGDIWTAQGKGLPESGR